MKIIKPPQISWILVSLLVWSFREFSIRGVNDSGHDMIENFPFQRADANYSSQYGSTSEANPALVLETAKRYNRAHGYEVDVSGRVRGDLDDVHALRPSSIPCLYSEAERTLSQQTTVISLRLRQPTTETVSNSTNTTQGTSTDTTQPITTTDIAASAAVAESACIRRFVNKISTEFIEHPWNSFSDPIWWDGTPQAIPEEWAENSLQEWLSHPPAASFPSQTGGDAGDQHVVSEGGVNEDVGSYEPVKSIAVTGPLTTSSVTVSDDGMVDSESLNFPSYERSAEDSAGGSTDHSPEHSAASRDPSRMQVPSILQNHGAIWHSPVLQKLFQNVITTGEEVLKQVDNTSSNSNTDAPDDVTDRPESSDGEATNLHSDANSSGSTRTDNLNTDTAWSSLDTAIDSIEQAFSESFNQRDQGFLAASYSAWLAGQNALQKGIVRNSGVQENTNQERRNSAVNFTPENANSEPRPTDLPSFLRKHFPSVARGLERVGQKMMSSWSGKKSGSTSISSNRNIRGIIPENIRVRMSEKTVKTVHETEKTGVTDKGGDADSDDYSDNRSASGRTPYTIHGVKRDHHHDGHFQRETLSGRISARQKIFHRDLDNVLDFQPLTSDNPGIESLSSAISSQNLFHHDPARNAHLLFSALLDGDFFRFVQLSLWVMLSFLSAVENVLGYIVDSEGGGIEWEEWVNFGFWVCIAQLCAWAAILATYEICEDTVNLTEKVALWWRNGEFWEDVIEVHYTGALKFLARFRNRLFGADYSPYEGTEGVQRLLERWNNWIRSLSKVLNGVLRFLPLKLFCPRRISFSKIEVLECSCCLSVKLSPFCYPNTVSCGRDHEVCYSCFVKHVSARMSVGNPNEIPCPGCSGKGCGSNANTDTNTVKQLDEPVPAQEEKQEGTTQKKPTLHAAVVPTDVEDLLLFSTRDYVRVKTRQLDYAVLQIERGLAKKRRESLVSDGGEANETGKQKEKGEEREASSSASSSSSSSSSAAHLVEEASSSDDAAKSSTENTTISDDQNPTANDQTPDANVNDQNPANFRDLLLREVQEDQLGLDVLFKCPSSSCPFFCFRKPCEAVCTQKTTTSQEAFVLEYGSAAGGFLEGVTNVVEFMETGGNERKVQNDNVDVQSQGEHPHRSRWDRLRPLLAVFTAILSRFIIPLCCLFMRPTLRIIRWLLQYINPALAMVIFSSVENGISSTSTQDPSLNSNGGAGVQDTDQNLDQDTSEDLANHFQTSSSVDTSETITFEESPEDGHEQADGNYGIDGTTPMDSANKSDAFHEVDSPRSKQEQMDQTSEADMLNHNAQNSEAANQTTDKLNNNQPILSKSLASNPLPPPSNLMPRGDGRFRMDRVFCCPNCHEQACFLCGKAWSTMGFGHANLECGEYLQGLQLLGFEEVEGGESADGGSAEAENLQDGNVNDGDEGNRDAPADAPADVPTGDDEHDANTAENSKSGDMESAVDTTELYCPVVPTEIEGIRTVPATENVTSTANESSSSSDPISLSDAATVPAADHSPNAETPSTKAGDGTETQTNANNPASNTDSTTGSTTNASAPRRRSSPSILIARPCPGCGASLSKVEGCDHVGCGRCGCEFCWRCGADWTPGHVFVWCTERDWWGRLGFRDAIAGSSVLNNHGVGIDTTVRFGANEFARHVRGIQNGDTVVNQDMAVRSVRSGDLSERDQDSNQGTTPQISGGSAAGENEGGITSPLNRFGGDGGDKT